VCFGKLACRGRHNRALGDDELLASLDSQAYIFLADKGQRRLRRLLLS
jgi:hypothetical protein